MATPSLAAFIGPALVLVCFGFMLYGMLCTQVHYYMRNYRDHPMIMSLVAFILLLETVHTGLCIHVVYAYFVIAWGNPIAISEVLWSVVTTIFLELIISTLVQGFYIYRIWRYRKNYVPVVFMTLTLLAHLGVALRATAYTAKFKTWEEVYAEKHFVFDLNCTFALNLILDVSITSVLAYYLYQDRSVAAKRGTKRMLNSLRTFAISAGAITVVASCALFISLSTTKNTLTFGGIIELIAKLYANSMLALLNARQSIVHSSRADTKFGLELTNLQSTPTPFSNPAPAAIHFHSQTTGITVSSETWVDKGQEASALEA
ncbi:hypothetical protein BC835DRAFT_1423693 [Cytidiella melzeri]|nr:hypothetical protein BC835DRAFT_1423693 [Cytidiella melzeri]